MNLTFADAFKTVKNKLDILGYKIGEQLVIIEDEVIVKEYYWVFFYNSKKYLETGDFAYALVGNAPIIVDKIHGHLYETGTAYDIQKYIEDFERNILPQII